jgi:nitroreductase
MDALQAIRKRRSVRQYTDEPVSDRDLDQILHLAMVAPSGGLSQAWNLVVVREPERCRQIADIVIRGGAEYFRSVRKPAADATPEEHAAWAKGYAEQALATYPRVPVWIVGLVVQRGSMPADQAEGERITNLMSLGMAFENLFVAARAKGLGTVPTIFHAYVERDLRTLLSIPDECEVPILTPLGHPVSFPEGFPPALQKAYRPWRTLVHDETWGNPRQAPDR